MGGFEELGFDGGDVLVSFVVGLIANVLALWVVCRFMLAVPDATLAKCAKLALALMVTNVVMLVILHFMALIPLIGPIIWLVMYFKALMATIEGVLELQEGGLTILILFLVVNGVVVYLVHQA